MTKISIYEISTYPKELVQIKNEFIKIIGNQKNNVNANKLRLYHFIEDCYYTASETSFSKVLKRIKLNLSENEIICFHNTRLYDLSEINNYGIRVPENGYIKRIENILMLEKVPSDSIDKIIKGVNNFLNGFQEDPCFEKNKQICFYLNIRDHKEYSKFYEMFGGEILERVVKALSIKDSIKNKILNLGVPCIVKFTVPFNEMDKTIQDEIVIKIFQFWIEKYFFKFSKLNNHCEGRILQEVSKDNIEKIIKLEEMND